jgi:colanic acid biosynthesis glycosyl transferase WcaI
MRILIYHMRYSPDATGTGPLVTELAMDLAALGDDVRVVTSVPHYGSDRVPDEFRGRLIYRGVEQGVSLWRTAGIARTRSSVFYRGLDYAMYTALSAPAGVATGPCDVVLAIAPPITVGLAGWAAARWRRCPLVFVAQDIWPDGLVSMGQLRSGIGIRAFRLLERLIYRMSSRVVVVSEGMRENIKAKGVSAERIHVVPNWVDTDAVKPMEKDNAFRRGLGLSDRFVILFAGNLGYAAGLEQVLAAARLLRGEERFAFLLVGSGSTKESLVRAAEEERLPNLVFAPTQPVERLPEVLAAADLSLVTLRSGMGNLSVPSKIYSYMASGRPILAYVPADSEVKRLVEEAGCGVWVSPDSPDNLAEMIRRMSSRSDVLDSMGKRAREYAARNCSRMSGAAAYHRVLHGAVAQFHDAGQGTRGGRTLEGRSE